MNIKDSLHDVFFKGRKMKKEEINRIIAIRTTIEGIHCVIEPKSFDEDLKLIIIDFDYLKEV